MTSEYSSIATNHLLTPCRGCSDEMYCIKDRVGLSPNNKKYDHAPRTRRRRHGATHVGLKQHAAKHENGEERSGTERNGTAGNGPMAELPM